MDSLPLAGDGGSAGPVYENAVLHPLSENTRRQPVGKHFYEKVVKVKADVAAILNSFLRLRSRSRPTIGTRLVPIGGMRKGGFSGAL